MEDKIKVLVIDDDSGIGEMLKTLLEFYGFHVTVTEVPDSAENLIIDNQIDAVMLDMLISGVNGTDVCSRLRNNKETENIPILMMSALHNAGDKCRKAGADDFIAKPFEMDDLIARIREIVEKRKNSISG